MSCETSGNLNVGGCDLINKKGDKLNNIESLGFPRILYSNKEFTNLEFGFDGYGVCSIKSYRVNNVDLSLNKLESFNREDCQKKYFERNQIPNH